MNERLGVLPFPGAPGSRCCRSRWAGSAPGQGVGQPVPVLLEVPELGLADPSALPAQPQAPDSLRDRPDDRVGGAGHHEPPHAAQPHGREPTGAGGTDGPGSARLSQLFEFAPVNDNDLL